jgi:hypothetical protein
MTRWNSLHLLLTFATLSGTAVLAQSGTTTALPTPNYTQPTPAPIVRAEPQAAPAPDAAQEPQPEQPNNVPQNRMRRAPRLPSTITSQPAPGVFLRAEHSATVETVSTSKDTVELRLTHGKANVTVHQPAQNTAILVDLPGGQVSLLKDGLYTFNADANRVSVLVGEARAYTSADKNDKGIKVKEDHQLVFSSKDPHAVDVGPYEARADLLPSGNHGEPYRAGYPGAVYSGAGFYGEPYPYGYPYAAWDYGYPYVGWGVPIGIGLGFGYYGGWRGGWGYRGWR